MSRYLPNEVFELDPAPPGPKPHPSARLLNVRGWMFLGMGLAGILTVALIVTADESYAGIDGMRAVRALVPEIEQDVSRLPFLGGIIGAIHDVAPTFLAPSPDSVAAVVPADGVAAAGKLAVCARPADRFCSADGSTAGPRRRRRRHLRPRRRLRRPRTPPLR